MNTRRPSPTITILVIKTDGLTFPLVVTSFRYDSMNKSLFYSNETEYEKGIDDNECEVTLRYTRNTHNMSNVGSATII